LAYGRGCAGWFRASRALGLFGGDAGRFRRAVQEYSEEDDRLLENLRHGIWLGGAEGLRALAKRMRLTRHREQPQTRAVLRSARGETVAAQEELAALRRPGRRVERPLRDVLVHLVWRSGDRRLSAVGEYFGIGPTGVAMAAHRGEAHLKTDRRLAERARRIIE